jgi:hypothetical protein
VGEGSGESDIPEPPKTHHKNAFVHKPNHLKNRLDTTPDPPVFPPQTNNFQEPIKLKSVLGNECFGKKGEKPIEEKLETKENPKPNPQPKPFHCEYCGRDVSGIDPGYRKEGSRQTPSRIPLYSY